MHVYVMNTCSVFEILAQLNFIQHIVAVSLVSAKSFSLCKNSCCSHPKGLFGRPRLVCSTRGNLAGKTEMSVSDIDMIPTGLCESGLWVIVCTVMLYD